MHIYCIKNCVIQCDYSTYLLARFTNRGDLSDCAIEQYSVYAILLDGTVTYQ